MLDSRATVNVIPATFIKDNKMENLLKKGKKLSVYGGKKFRTEGTLRVELLSIKEKWQPLSWSWMKRYNWF